MMNGFTDKPTHSLGEDSFGVQQYITGLNDFIMECYTPMTIAIQGDWGSGKTSMMNMIREQLGDRVVTTWFNTWQYSQFNMGDSLAISFLSRLIADLDTEQDKDEGNIKKALRTISKFAKTASVIAADTFIGGKAAETLENGIALSVEQPEIDMPQAINELKSQFQAAVNKKIEQTGKDRLVIFIDDLDRLHPGKAVELLEVLKLFLDCDNCVFVLAIDYAVVSQGVKQKYGELIGEEKGRSFFDKIIQVPFKMPVAQYNVKNYVASSMQTLGIQVPDSELESYVKLIQKSVGCNPRAMKRLFNAFLLLNKIASSGIVIEESQRRMLFAILCLQLSFENVYNYIVQNADDCYDGALLQSLTTPETYTDGDEAEHLSRELNIGSDADITNVVEFMTVFVNVLDQDGDGILAEGEVTSFINILRFSTITANTSSTTTSDSNLESHYRYYNRDIIKDVLVKIQGNYNNPIKLYQTRTNNNPEWKKHYAGAWKPIQTSYGNVNYEFKIATSLQNKTSSLSVNIYPADKTDRHKFFENMKEWYDKQSYGFAYLEENCRFWLNTKNVDADSREEIIEYFTSLIPTLTEEIEGVLLR